MSSPTVLHVMGLATTMVPADFVAAHLLGGECHVFAWDATRYAAFRQEMGAKLGLAQNRITLVGSAKVGFSMNPEALLRDFGSNSDLDVVVVAPDVFDAAALELAEEKNLIRRAGEEERRRLKKG